MSRNILFLAIVAIVFILSISGELPVYGQETIFHEDFESGQGNWWADNGTWEVGIPTVGPQNSHSGKNVAGTVLGGDYPTYANTRLISPDITFPNLLSEERLQLKFWHWFSLGSGAQGVVQISVAGGAWQTISNLFDDYSGAWTQYIADLSMYADSTVRIAFHFLSGFYSTRSGWYIDDLAIIKTTVVFRNPEDFELGIGDWWADNGSWEVGIPTVGPNSAHSGQNVAATVLDGNYSEYANTRLISTKITLYPAPGETPKLRFWHWFNLGSGAHGVVQIFVDEGDWQSISNQFTGSSGTWSQYIINLSAYAASTVRIAFYFNSDFYSTRAGWYIDDVKIEGIITPSILVTPILLDFSNVLVGQTAIDTIFVTNTGTDVLNIGPINISGTNADNFSVDTTSFTLATSESKILEVNFTPVSQSNFNASLNINSNGGNVSVDINGNGIVGSVPTATTNAATNISTTSATLNGIVNPNGLSTTVKFEYGTTTNYGGEITATPSPITGTSAASVSTQLTGLSPNTTYHYRLVAANSVGTTNGDDQTFTTPSSGSAPTATTNAATNLSETSATLNGAVNPNGLSTMVKFQYGTTTSYGSEVTATAKPVTGTSTVSVSAQLTGLIPNTTYHFRLVATNSAGTTNGADQIFTTSPSGSAPTAITNAATNVTTTSATLNGTVNPNGLNTIVKFQYGTTTSYGNEVTADQSPLNGTVVVTVNAPITGLSQNTTYHYQIVATNSMGTSTGKNQTLITPLDYPSTISLDNTVIFPYYTNASDYDATEYRLVGLPGASDLLVYSLLAGIQNIDWQLYWDNGAAQDYFMEFDGSANFKFCVGRAFWLIHKDSWSVNTTVPSATLNASQQVDIPLHSGWNLITNPFTSAILWSAVQNVNGILQPIWSYNGSFSQSSHFNPYHGYYFDNTDNKLTLLSIPYGNSLTKTIRNYDEDFEEWKVQITLIVGNSVDKAAWFGISKQAKPGLDHFDYRKPRTIATVPMTYFNRPNWDAEYNIFAADFRPRVMDVESWKFCVYTNQQQPVKLIFSKIYKIPSQFEVYLFHEDRGKYINLRDDSLYCFVPSKNNSNFSVVVGKKDDVVNSVYPLNFAVGSNYPNPFNSSTVIPVSIPATSEIELDIYNILGDKVKTIYNGTLQRGRYLYNWDGKNKEGITVPSGVYIFALRTTNKNVYFSNKMILIK